MSTQLHVYLQSNRDSYNIRGTCCNTHVFSLFAKDIRQCLRTIDTFSTNNAPNARAALQTLEGGQSRMVRWLSTTLLSVLDVRLQMILRGSRSVIGGSFPRWGPATSARHAKPPPPPVGTEASKQAVRERMALEQRWEAVEQEILQTANDAQRDTHKAG